MDEQPNGFKPPRSDVSGGIDAFSNGRWSAILIAALVNGYCMVQVVPKFRIMFDSLHGELPGVTQSLLAESQFITNWFFIILIISGLAAFLILKFRIRLPWPWFAALLFALIFNIVLVPVGIFYPILQLQAAVRESSAH